jgi:hypothetical protein
MVGRIYSPQMIIHYKYTKNAENNQVFWTLFLYFLIKQFNMEKRYYSRCMYGGYEQSDFKPSERFEGQSGTRYHFWIKVFCMGLILALLLIIGLCFTSCRTQPPTVIQKEEIIWTYKDSITTRDSTVIIPIERYVDIVPIYDTLVLENSIAISRSWADTTNHLLRGELKNKNAIQYQVKYVERVVTNDSIVEREVPVPYEVEVVKTHIPTWAWITLVWALITVASIAWSVYKRFRKI